MGDGGYFGSWSTDSEGLPCFDIELSRLSRDRLVLPEGDERRMWHLLGNDRVTATAHAGGWTVLYSTEEGMLRLNGSDPLRVEELGGTWGLFDSSGRELLSPFTPGLELALQWGTGYAEWRASLRGLSVTRRTWAPLEALPALRIDVSIDVSDDCPFSPCSYVERWGFKPYPIVLGALMSRRLRAPASYTSAEKLAWHLLFTGSSLCRRITESTRAALGRRMALTCEYEPALGAFILEPGRGREAHRAQRRSALSRLPGVAFVASLPAGGPAVSEVAPRWESAGPGAVAVALGVPLDADRGRTNLSFAAGISDRDKLPVLLDSMNDVSLHEAAASRWSGLSLEMPSSPALEREAVWNALYLRSSTVYDSFFSCRFVPQGSAYGFVHGMHGAIRDYAITCVPLTYIDPLLAREMLTLIMRLTYPDGGMAYAHTGSGFTTSAVIHGEPTDLPLFFLWALTEYVWATGDFGFLDEAVPFCRRRGSRAAAGTVRERALLAWRRTRDAAGTGAHGMLLAGSGDWCDPLVLMVPGSRDFHRRGESGFNTAFAVYVLPRAAELLSATNPAEAASMLEYAGELRLAMERAWSGRWFLRGWDGRGGPIGAEHLFLDAQAWCLIARIGTDEQRRALVGTIAETCDDPSPIGATILDRPHPVRLGVLAPGWDCNGGVWSAINGLLTWAYALHDPELAWRSLEKQSFAAHARAYPHVWFGIWSGPDSYNAHYAERPGETFVQPATPMAEFPVMNSNAHAGPLLALLKTLGVEAGPEGVTVTPALPRGAVPWHLATALFDAECGEAGVTIVPRSVPR